MAWLQVENGKITEGLGYMEHHIVPLPALRFPHFFGDRPGVAALSVQALHGASDQQPSAESARLK